MSALHSHGIRARQSGFTLVEMLVTLAILAMISSLLWQAMQQVLRVENLLQRSGVEGQLITVRREWLRGAIKASFVERSGVPRQFQGDAQSLRFASAELVDFPGHWAGQIQVRLETGARSGIQRLLLSDGRRRDLFTDDLSHPPEDIELLTWEGRPGFIRYLDERGAWHEQWPPARAPIQLGPNASDEAIQAAGLAALPRLPRAVWLQLGGDAGGSLIVALSVTDPGRTTLIQWESQ